MSFILDALRKSEHERRQEEVPSIAHVPLAPPRAHLPPWAVAVMLLLLISVLALTWAWWTHVAPGARLAEQAPPTPAARVPDRLSVTAEERSEPVERPVTLSSIARQAPAPVAPVSGAAPAPAADVQPPAAAIDVLSLPSMGELAAQGIAVPPLTLQLHVFSDDPSRRLVFINGGQYREGDNLRDGPRVVAILPEGVVLAQQGRQFLLPRN